MQKKYCLILVLICTISATTLYGQTSEISGRVVAKGDVENIHVINVTLNKFTTTNNLGTFKIPAKFGDTLKFTSVRYKTKLVVMSRKIIQDKTMDVYLEENINVLNEVVVGKVLTGDLGSDILNSDAKRDINFYDLGLPGYTGKPLTQSERRLAEADGGKFVYVNLGVGVNLHKILNAVSGRTKMLKERVRLERNSELMSDIRDRLAKDFFSLNPLSEKYIEEFFFFCSEDPNFELRCKDKSDIHVLEFLKEKYQEFNENLKTQKD